MRPFIKWLTATVVWSIIWLFIIIGIGGHYPDPMLQKSLPTLYFWGIAVYAILLLAVKWLNKE